MVISSRKDFDALLTGFNKLRAITYVASPDLLLDFFEKHGYTEVEVLVGENLSEPYHDSLKQKGMKTIEQLAELIERGTLRIFIPSRNIHTKLYILEGQGFSRVISSSANFTTTAREASRQMNYAWYVDLLTDDPFLAQVVNDYQTHLKLGKCELFMGDLLELIRKSQSMPREQIIKIWIEGESADEANLEVKETWQKITRQSLDPSFGEPIFTVQLPKSPQGIEIIRKSISRHLNAPIVGEEIQINWEGFCRYFEKDIGLPPMYVNLEKSEVVVGVNGTINLRTAPLPEPAVVNRALEHIETYFNGVDTAQTLDATYAKMSMFEALLYLFFAPFANEYKRAKRKHYGIADPRGPRFLFIYGPSYNGKSHFCQFALKLLTGHVVQPLSSRDHFNKRAIDNIRTCGIQFPLLFDDVESKRITALAETLKSYWESGWEEDYPLPQIILTSNEGTIKEWAKSRVKRIVFDAHFLGTESEKQRLGNAFRQDNEIFTWFTHLYFPYLNDSEPPSNDELHHARLIFKEMYRYAGRPLPEFFPNEMVENLYDPDRKVWNELFQLKHAKTQSKDNRLIIKFGKDMQFWEVERYRSCLPQSVKCDQRRGNTLVIESPNEFGEWLKEDPTYKRSRLGRLFRR